MSSYRIPTLAANVLYTLVTEDEFLKDIDKKIERAAPRSKERDLLYAAYAERQNTIINAYIEHLNEMRVCNQDDIERAK